MTACFLGNISAKYYKNPSMLSRVIAKDVGDVFLRHSVVAIYSSRWHSMQRGKKPATTLFVSFSCSVLDQIHCIPYQYSTVISRAIPVQSMVYLPG